MTPHVVFIVPAVGAALAFAHWKLNKNVQELRLELASEGEDFLLRSGVPVGARKDVKHALDTAFGLRLTILLGFLLVPFIAITYVFRQRWMLRSIDDRYQMENDAQISYRRICDLHDRITFVNHFILFPILSFEISLFMMPAVLIRGVLRGSVDNPRTSDVVLGLIEHRSISEWTTFQEAA